jgi:hypothetical protein
MDTRRLKDHTVQEEYREFLQQKVMVRDTWRSWN